MEMFAVNFGSHHASAFLNELYRDETISNKTWNNYLTFFRSLWNWMVEQQYAVQNQFSGFTKKQAERKQRIVIPAQDREKIKEHLAINDPHLLMVSLLVFHALLRPKEISMLKPEYFMLHKQVIRIPAAVAKNRNERMATIPDALMPFLVEWDFNGAKTGDFIWSQNLVPGSRPIKSTRWSQKWNKLRNEVKLPKEMVLYSLRDSGIVQLLQDGISPRDVMLHADHSSLEITSQYVKQAFPEGMASIKSKGGKF
jgi:integrase/recombinase XerD